MLIRGTMMLRNEALIAKREALGLTQKEAAGLACVSLDHYSRLERLDFSSNRTAQAAIGVAEAFDLDLDAIAPEALAGQRIENKAVQIANINPARLLSWANPARFILPSPADEAEKVEAADALHDAMGKMLNPRQLEVVRRRYGLDGQEPQDYGTIGKAVGLTRERVRQIEARAINRLRRPNEENPNPLAPFIRDAE